VWTRVTLQAKNIVIATGGSASRAPIPGAEHCIISDEVRGLNCFRECS
jgi:pyruvate/2-oxoglutarate dehydrogenase complex dihydrolipoamide dehydrogenase (E3) component